MTEIGSDEWKKNFAVIHVALGPDKHGVTHARAWEISVEAAEQSVAMLTAAYGTPTEWIDDGKNPTLCVYPDGSEPS